MANLITQVTQRGRGVAGGQAWVDVDVTGPSSYSTGGMTPSAAQLQAIFADYPGGTLADVQFFSSERSIGGYHLSLDRSAGKILFFDENSEASGDLDAITVRVRFWYGQLTGAGVGEAIEA